MVHARVPWKLYPCPGLREYGLGPTSVRITEVLEAIATHRHGSCSAPACCLHHHPRTAYGQDLSFYSTDTLTVYFFTCGVPLRYMRHEQCPPPVPRDPSSNRHLPCLHRFMFLPPPVASSTFQVPMLDTTE